MKPLLNDKGVIARYREFLPVTDATPVVSLSEGSTPLIHSPKLSEKTGAEVYLKFEGLNPTGSFKDRGMTVAISKAVERGAKAVICASTGNTSAAAVLGYGVTRLAHPDKLSTFYFIFPVLYFLFTVIHHLRTTDKAVTS